MSTAYYWIESVWNQHVPFFHFRSRCRFVVSYQQTFMVFTTLDFDWICNEKLWKVYLEEKAHSGNDVTHSTKVKIGVTNRRILVLSISKGSKFHQNVAYYSFFIISPPLNSRASKKLRKSLIWYIFGSIMAHFLAPYNPHGIRWWPVWVLFGLAIWMWGINYGLGLVLSEPLETSLTVFKKSGFEFSF